MTEAHQPSEKPTAPPEVVIPDATWELVKGLPADLQDAFAETVRGVITGETDIAVRELVPHPVDHSPGRPHVPVPASRGLGYLRAAVAEISPPTVEVFDQELRQDTASPDPNERLVGLRVFVVRWIEYIGLHGDHETARHLAAAPTPQDYAARYAEAMERIHAENFGPSPERFQVRQLPTGVWQVHCPITHVSAQGATEERAHRQLRARMLDLL